MESDNWIGIISGCISSMMNYYNQTKEIKSRMNELSCSLRKSGLNFLRVARVGKHQEETIEH